MRSSVARALACAVASAWLAAAPAAHADEYPNRPIHIVVPTAPGGLSDLSARVFGKKLQEDTRQPVIIDNRPGAGGIIGAELAAKATPDGYTLFVGAQQPLAILPNLKANLPYDPVKDFAPVAHMVASPLVLVVHPAVPVKTVAELVALAKKEPGKLTYGSAGLGSMGQLTGEEFKQAAGLDIVHVPYKGVAPAGEDLLAGHISMTFDLVVNVVQHVKAGELRALAVTVPQRVPALPDVPTMAEVGLPQVEATNWFALFAPAKTPPDIVAWLNREADKIFAEPDVRQRFEEQSVGLPGGTPQDLAAYAAAERERWRRVIDTAGIKIE